VQKAYLQLTTHAHHWSSSRCLGWTVPRNLSASQLLCFHITVGSGLMCLQNVRSKVLKYVYLLVCNPAKVYDCYSNIK
jgi:hypothetical protein